MAIDLIGDVMRDIQRMHKSSKFVVSVVRPSIDAHSQKMLELTSQGRNPQGNRYAPLAPSYKKRKERANLNGIPDLRYGLKGGKTMDTLYSTSGFDGGQIGFKKDKGLAENKRYMNRHQTGKNIAKRKVFPEEQDIKVGSSASIVKKVKGILLDYLMTPRQIKGTVRG